MSRITPDLEVFAASYGAGKPQLVSTTLVADMETPVSASLKLSSGEPYHFLLESVEGGAVRGRYSIIGLKPDIIWRCNGSGSEINRTALADPETGFQPCDHPPLQSLRQLLAESRIPDMPEDMPPMSAGVVGYMGYDMVRLMEKLPAAKPDPIGTPDAIFIRPTLMVIFDSVKDVATLVTPVWPNGKVSAEQAYARACDRLYAALDRFEQAAALPQDGVPAPDDLPDPVSNTPRDVFFDMVRRAKTYILAGDIFQVVLSQRFTLPFTLPSMALYRALRRTNPSPYMYHLVFGDFAIVGSSPEILVALRDGKVTIRPIAGTRPRGETPAEDKALEEGLLHDQKELAEHLMLLDLGRNDVGRISKIGTVEVTEQNIIERYSHVMHIVSNVEGQLDPNYDAIDALSAGFPAGTVSGAPKVRAMEIIDELEVDKRGIYAGAVGYFSANGNMDTAIVLRTAVVKNNQLHVQAGAGIVADSQPDYEQNECEAKARALVRAASEAVRYANMPGRGQ